MRGVHSIPRCILLCLVFLAVMSGGCSPVDFAHDVPLGTKLPEKDVRGLLRTSIGAGSYEKGFVPFPWIEGAKSCQLLTDENGIVIAKGYHATAVFDLVPFVLLADKTLYVLEVQVPEDWYSVPACWTNTYVYSEMEKYRKKVMDAPPQQQRQLLQEWEKNASPPFDKNILDYMQLIAMQVESIPTGKPASDSRNYEFTEMMMYFLDSSVRKDFNKHEEMKAILNKGGTLSGKTSRDDNVTLENLGNRRFRLTLEQTNPRPGVVPLTAFYVTYAGSFVISTIHYVVFENTSHKVSTTSRAD